MGPKSYFLHAPASKLSQGGSDRPKWRFVTAKVLATFSLNVLKSAPATQGTDCVWIFLCSSNKFWLRMCNFIFHHFLRAGAHSLSSARWCADMIKHLQSARNIKLLYDREYERLRGAKKNCSKNIFSPVVDCNVPLKHFIVTPNCDL